MELTAEVQGMTPNFLDVHQFNGFTAEKKRLFLELFAKNPNITACADSLGIVRQTIFYAAERDPEFRRAFDAVKEGLSDGLEAKVHEYGQRPNNFMDRIAWLRARRPEVWNPMQQIAVTVEMKQHERLAAEAKEYINTTATDGSTVKPSP
jgi:hypothetical protein